MQSTVIIVCRSSDSLDSRDTILHNVKDQAYYKSDMMPTEYHCKVNKPMFYLDRLLTNYHLDVILTSKS